MEGASFYRIPHLDCSHFHNQPREFPLVDKEWLLNRGNLQKVLAKLINKKTQIANSSVMLLISLEMTVKRWIFKNMNLAH